MVRWEKVEHVHQRHGIPADGAAPEIGRRAGGLVRPRLLLAFVPTVIKKPRRRVISVRGHQKNLLGDVIEGSRGLVEQLRILGGERPGHVKTEYAKRSEEHTSE